MNEPWERRDKCRYYTEFRRRKKITKNPQKIANTEKRKRISLLKDKQPLGRVKETVTSFFQLHPRPYTPPSPPTLVSRVLSIYRTHSFKLCPLLEVTILSVIKNYICTQNLIPKIARSQCRRVFLVSVKSTKESSLFPRHASS